MKWSSAERYKVLLSLALLLLFACQDVDHPRPLNSDFLTESADNNLPPEPSSQIVDLESLDQAQPIKKATSNNFMVVTANPHATAAAKKILLQGGTAIDAAIAAQLVLGLVEPQSSGIGGGGFLLYWDAKQKILQSYDGRETAPSSVDENLFFSPESGQTDKFFSAVLGGKSVGVPGLVKMLELAHQQHGELDWQQLFSPAIQLADQGFAVSERLNTLLRLVPKVKQRDEIKQYFFDQQGQPLAIGTQLKNPDYAQTLEKLAEQGGDYLYRSELTQKIITAVNQDNNVGYLTAKDFTEYQPVERAPVCRQIFSYRLCGMGPPSSGATTVLATLLILEQLAEPMLVAGQEPIENNPLLAHYFIEALRLAFADRNTYVADPEFISVPVNQLLATDYLAKRAQLISPKRAMPDVAAGDIALPSATRFMTQDSPELESTTHLSIVDQLGNAVSMTTSIETAFGSRLMVGGFLLNNQLTDFSFRPRDVNQERVANRVEGGKRPRSSMSPMIVFDQHNQPVLIIGSPGGKRIIPYVAGFIYEVLALGRAPEVALQRPHITSIGRGVEVEQGAPASLIDGLAELGHRPKVKYQTSGLHLIYRKQDQWLGLADPRREGTAVGK
ncbi:MAG: gamma-glutamyltransferase [Pseudomonadales bacterium]|nr:gamma-glutamyltransferase [Pseudomonadales bacterium]